jgi:hypothetical protein
MSGDSGFHRNDIIALTGNRQPATGFNRQLATGNRQLGLTSIQ